MILKICSPVFTGEKLQKSKNKTLLLKRIISNNAAWLL
jgi:hypothetical protein